jgi:hypothetical protein
MTLVFIPFGKFFHVIQRPASVGVEIYKRSALERDGVFHCRRCGQPLEARAFVSDLKQTMDELELGFSDWAETCPRCKRVLRGQAYLDTVKRGLQVSDAGPGTRWWPPGSATSAAPAGPSRPPTGRRPRPGSGWSRPTAVLRRPMRHVPPGDRIGA